MTVLGGPCQCIKDIHEIFLYILAGGDSYQEGVACYRLGNAYQQSGEYDKAVQVGRTTTNTHVHGTVICMYVLAVP